MNTAERKIPTIDFAGFTEGDAVRRNSTVAELSAALASCGFMYLRNHGVAQHVVDEVFVQSRRFFSLAPDVKAKAKPKEKGRTRGYEGVGVQALGEGQPGFERNLSMRR